MKIIGIAECRINSWYEDGTPDSWNQSPVHYFEPEDLDEYIENHPFHVEEADETADAIIGLGGGGVPYWVGDSDDRKLYVFILQDEY